MSTPPARAPGSFGALVNVNYDTVEEVRIVALGSRAEYGSYSGAAIDVLTKSGSNDFHGSGAFYSKIGDVANNQPAPGENFGSDFLYVGEGDDPASEIKKDWEAAFTAGGPIVKDKLWFFGAFDYVRGASLPALQTVESESWGRYADLKLSAAPFKNHLAYVAYHYENNDGNGWSWGSPPGWDTTMIYGSKQKNNTISAQWQWVPGSKTTLSGKWLGFWTKDNPYIPEDAPANPGYINWWKWTDAYGSYGVGGGFPYVEGYNSSRNTIQGDVSHYAEGFLGEHDIKFGVQYTKGRSDSKGGYFQNYVNFLYPYRWTQSVANMQSWYGDTGLVFYNNKDTINPFLTARTADSLGAFFDDQWTPNRRLTINLGLRFDHMTSKYGAGKVYDFPSSPDAINDPPPVLRDRASTDNIFDFKTWAPRVGLSYQLTADGKTVVRAAYGRYYMPLTAEFLRRFGPDMPPVNRTYEQYLVGPVGHGGHERRRNDRLARDARRGPEGPGAHAVLRRGAGCDRYLLDPEHGRQPQGPAHGPVHAEPRTGARQEPLGGCDVHLQTHQRHLRQHPHQPGDRPAVGVRARPLHDVPRACT